MKSIKLPMEMVIEDLTQLGGDFAVVEREVDGIRRKVYAKTPANLAVCYQLALVKRREAVFLVDGKHHVTLDQTYRSAARLAYGLSHYYNVSKGNRVALALDRPLEWMTAFMAITALGAIVVPMNTLWTGHELRRALADCGARVMFADARRLNRMLESRPPVMPATIVVGAMDQVPEGMRRYGELMDLTPLDASMPDVHVSQDDDALLLYTSGAARAVKGVVSTHRAIMTSLISWLVTGIAGLALVTDKRLRSPHRVTLLNQSLSHLAGCLNLFLFSYMIGRKLVVMGEWNPQEALHLMSREAVTHFCCVPTAARDLCDAAENQGAECPSLRELSVGGEAVPVELLERLARVFHPTELTTSYALTETNGLGAMNTGKYYLERKRSVGKPMQPMVSIKVVDAEGNALPPGITGEILIESTSNFRAYWNDPKTTARAFSDGWFHTGDLGYLDEGGFLYVVGRLKDVVVSDGEMIGCIEVEQALEQHETVEEAAVFGLPDKAFGELVAALVHPRVGCSPHPDELHRFLKSRLAGFKLPRYIWIADAPLPRLSSGKVDRAGIRIQYLAMSTGQKA